MVRGDKREGLLTERECGFCMHLIALEHCPKANHRTKQIPLFPQFFWSKDLRHVCGKRCREPCFCCAQPSLQHRIGGDCPQHLRTSQTEQRTRAHDLWWQLLEVLVNNSQLTQAYSPGKSRQL